MLSESRRYIKLLFTDICPLGYKYKAYPNEGTDQGLLPGWGSIMSVGSQKSRGDCARRCSKDYKCKFFEHRYTATKKTKCYTVERLPTPGGGEGDDIQDFVLCTKLRKIFALLL